MCFDFGGAEAARNEAARQEAELHAREAKRQGDITQGKQSIDNAFSQFNDGYYNRFKDTYTAAYKPQIQNQYDIANDKLVASLAGRGQLEGTVGAHAMGQLAKTKYDAEGQLANSAVDAAGKMRSEVENQKTGLYGLNASAADPAGIATQAQGSASSIVAPNAYPTLGDIFGSALQPWALAAKTNASSLNPVGFGGRLASGSGSGVFG